MALEDQGFAFTRVVGREAFDAMTHARPYRASLPRAKALEEVRALKGTQFVPAAADALLSLPVESL